MNSNSLVKKESAIRNLRRIGIELDEHPYRGRYSSLMVIKTRNAKTTTAVIVQFTTKDKIQPFRYTIGVNYTLCKDAAYLLVILDDSSHVYVIPTIVMEKLRTESPTRCYANNQWFVDFHPMDHLLRPQGSQMYCDISQYELRQQMM